MENCIMNDFENQNEIFEKVSQHLRAVAQRQMPDFSDDLVQETLFCFFDNLHKGKYRGGNSYPEYFSYALGILKNIIIKQIKKKQNDRKTEIEFNDDPKNFFETSLTVIENSESTLLKNEEEYQNNLLIAKAREIFLQFPPHIQELIHLHVVEGWSYTRLSKHFNIPKQTLVSRFNSAIEKIRKKLDLSHTNYKKKYLKNKECL